MRVDTKCFTPRAMQNLMRYPWPGNNRQLENEVRRLITSVRGKTITEEHLDPSSRHPETIEISSSADLAAQEAKATPAAASAPQTLGEAVEALELQMIEDALRQCHGTNRKLGLSRQGLIKKFEEAGDLMNKRMNSSPLLPESIISHQHRGMFLRTSISTYVYRSGQACALPQQEIKTSH